MQPAALHHVLAVRPQDVGGAHLVIVQELAGDCLVGTAGEDVGQALAWIALEGQRHPLQAETPVGQGAADGLVQGTVSPGGEGRIGAQRGPPRTSRGLVPERLQAAKDCWVLAAGSSSPSATLGWRHVAPPLSPHYS